MPSKLYYLILFAGTSRDHYSLAISISEKFLSTAQIALMKLALSLRIYSAKVDMFTQMAEMKDDLDVNCVNFVEVGGKFTCSSDELPELLNQVSYRTYAIFLCIYIYKVLTLEKLF